MNTAAASSGGSSYSLPHTTKALCGRSWGKTTKGKQRSFHIYEKQTQQAQIDISIINMPADKVRSTVIINRQIHPFCTQPYMAIQGTIVFGRCALASLHCHRGCCLPVNWSMLFLCYRANWVSECGDGLTLWYHISIWPPLKHTTIAMSRMK